MGIDVKVLVNEVKAVLLAVVAEDVMFFVSIAKFHDLPADQIANAASHTNEGEAVGGDPETRLNSLRELIDKVEGLLKTIFHVLLLEDALSDGLVHSRAIEF